jgi:hypothetical protein
MNKEQIEKVLEMLMSAKFERWYENEFMDFVEGVELPPSKKEILQDLENMLK